MQLQAASSNLFFKKGLHLMEASRRFCGRGAWTAEKKPLLPNATAYPAASLAAHCDRHSTAPLGSQLRSMTGAPCDLHVIIKGYT
ncbi:hypothetical protein NDU88_008422 [Pleurodeles waltl]|uniref:Uncharacterized protein n=1 Tax=Pleurodeles waltl TaxID=8319 RepID=A0AAV7QPU9_PLEWA|nr:hypothetical protein NDU88_008422 [Pleurodeles waltl]